MPLSLYMQTYTPRNQSWFEQQFNYRVTITIPRGQWEPFTRIKDWLQSDTARWGEYRVDWFGHVWSEEAIGFYNFYFMCQDRAMWFKLSVDL